MVAFQSPQGVFCYQVMLFGLKNTGATYQRLIIVTYKKMLGDTIECYFDDLDVRL